MNTVLLLEDDVIVMKANKGILELEDFRVLACYSLEEAWEVVRKTTPDLLVLDIMLPDGNGVDFCKEYRAKYGKNVPVLFLSVLSENEDIIKGYGAGGVDYLVKPFAAEMLLIKVRALLENKKAASEVIILGNLRLDDIACIATLDGADLLLKPKGFALLKYLMLNRGKFVSAEILYEKVWGMAAIETNQVKKQIHYLRTKLDGSAFVIDFENSEGYRLTMKQ